MLDGKEKDLNMIDYEIDKSKNIKYIQINDIHSQVQFRKNFKEEELLNLSESIKSYGVLQPIIVSQEDNNYKIIAGERRWRAAKTAGLTLMPCIILNKEDQELSEISLVENIQRENLSPVEEAKAIYNLLNKGQYTHEKLANKIGKNRSTISNLIRILSLEEEVLDGLDKNLITLGHAKILCGINDSENQIKIYKEIIKKSLSVKQTEELINSEKKIKNTNKSNVFKDIPRELRELSDQFKGHLGTKVKITGNSEQGTIEIHYYTLEDLERVSDLIMNGE